MSANRYKKILPAYKGNRWLDVELPGAGVPWLQGKRRSLRKRNTNHARATEELGALLERYPWTWPKQPIYFFSDPHADADAMLASLVCSGGIKKTGPADSDFRLTKAGRKAHFLIGGDCFDKGPSNLRLLRTLHGLSEQGAFVRILAGNHDVRVMLGMRSIGGKRNRESEHFFIRMGAKSVPFLSEVYRGYINRSSALRNMPGQRECRRRLYPSERWFDEFPTLAERFLPPKTIDRELQRITTKLERFEQACDQADLSMKMVYASALKWQELFLTPSGEFAWFFKQMRLALRRGTFLFIHAGLDDHVAALLRHGGVGYLNRKFQKQLRHSGFELYYGPIANAIRTKYRPADRQLSRHGAEDAHHSGIHAIVHGHRNLLHGQRIALRKGMINFECDITMDCNSRRKEGLEGAGAGVTIFNPDGVVVGISTDYTQAKVFEPRTQQWDKT